ncbi:MAG TPA: alpha/beta fold hydrolase, partial [Gemmatimonadaceae bacterium]|nr:alpha/beta fold hydrolase [Gemmatimonadaceae bacterium]
LVPVRHERWPTPDDDLLDVYRLDAPEGAPRLLFLHGLEGGLRSHYVAGTFARAHRLGWSVALLVFRSCGSEPNRARRFYHSGETEDLGLVVDRLIAERPHDSLLLAGVSLGGNVLLKWLGERGDAVPPQVAAAAAVSVPFDLARGARHIGRGFGRVYERHFLRSLRRKAEEKLSRYPDLCAREPVLAARTLWEFDDTLTAPVHGFAGAADYYARSSSLAFLDAVRVPTLLLSAEDDPFLPPAVLDEVRRIAGGNRWLHPEFVRRGGHVGFVGGRVPWRPDWYAERRIVEFLASRLPPAPRLALSGSDADAGGGVALGGSVRKFSGPPPQPGGDDR